MAREPEGKRISQWHKRTKSADRVYKRWAEEYRIADCEQFYYGHQWDIEKAGESKYVINMIMPTIETKIPRLMFNTPGFRIIPRPSITDDPMSTIVERCRLQEDTLNTVVSDPRVQFREEILRALKESFWAFGLIEIGYTADFIDNPSAGRPVLDEDNNTPLKDASGAVLLHPDALLEDEYVYVKHIPAAQFRVGVRQHPNMEYCDWVGYWEWHWPSDIKANRRYKNTRKLKTGGRLDRALSDPGIESEDPTLDPENASERRDMIRVWKVWDLRRKVRHVFADDQDKFFIEDEPWTYLPFAGLRHVEIANRWLPVPPIFNWLSPQVELNETREMQRVHRKRFLRRYLKDPSIEAKEMEKLAGDEDGVWIEGMKDAITPIQDAPLDAGVVRNIPLSKDDLREISGTSGDQRGIPESETATQANLIQLSANIRENYSRMDVSRWLCHIGRLLLITLRQNAALPIWIKHNVDELSPGAAQEEPIIEELWRQIQAEDLGNVIHDVQLDPTELSPLGEELERNNFFQGLSILSNPQFGAILLGSPLLLRKALRYFRITNARDIAEIQNALLMGQMLAAASVSAQGGSPGGGPPAQGDLLPASAPGQGRDNSQIAMQIAKQLSGGQVQ